MSKVEEVARAIFEADIASTQKEFPGTPPNVLRVAAESLFNDHHIPMARAAIEAMRGPTAQMCDAGEGFNIRCGCADCDHTAQQKVAAGFDAMISKALNEEG